VSLRCRVCAAASLVVLLAWSPSAAAEAAEKAGAGTAAADGVSSNSAGGAAPGSSISGARRELDAIKALRDPAQVPKGELPKLTMPELRTAAPEAIPWGAKPGSKADTAGKQSANWLVDGVMKDGRRANDLARKAKDRGGRDDRGEHADRTESGARTLEATETEIAQSANPEPRDEGGVQREKEVGEVANPLNRYLGEWLTPRDYAMLKPSLDEAAAGGRTTVGLDPRIAAALGPDSLVAAMPTSGLATGESATAIDAVRQAAPRENPFLEALQPIVSPKPASIVALPAPPPPSVASIAQPIVPSTIAPNSPPLIAPPQSKIPDFAKPAQDEKYFKQLKRF